MAMAKKKAKEGLTMPRAGLDQAAILEAAVSLADAHGVEGVSLAMLAQQLGVRPPSLYNHVNGLPELRRQLALFSLQQLYARMEEAAGAKRDESALYRVVDAYLAFAREHPGLYESMQRAPEAADGEMQQAGELIVELMLEFVRNLGLAEGEEIHAVRGLRSILHGFASLSKLEGFGLPYLVDESLKFTLRSFFNGISKDSFGILSTPGKLRGDGADHKGD